MIFYLFLLVIFLKSFNWVTSGGEKNLKTKNFIFSLKIVEMHKRNFFWVK